MFTDVRGFTTISEHYGKDVQGLTKIMNRYMTAMTTNIIKNNGTLDKYIGDAQMAFWNAPLYNGQHAKDAVKTALQMMESLNEFNCKTVKKENLTPETCFRNMFNQIPGVSNSIAGVLCDKYKNMENFIFELKGASGNRKIEIINLISNEKYGSNMRRVGEKTAEKIYIYVFNDTGEIISLNELKKKNTVKKKKDLKIIL
jgi:hypothetical protein